MALALLLLEFLPKTLWLFAQKIADREFNSPSSPPSTLVLFFQVHSLQF
jgi:hypothetical protein